MYSRSLSLFFLLGLVGSAIAAPAPVAFPDPEPAVGFMDVAERVETRDVSIIEARATGKATYYYPNVGVGACGKRYKNTDLVAALDPSNYKRGKSCGKYITIKSGKKSVRVKIVDLCPGCQPGHVDVSPRAFKALAPLSKGVINVSWNFS